MCGADASTDTDTDTYINDGAPYLRYVFVNQGETGGSDVFGQVNRHSLTSLTSRMHINSFSQPVYFFLYHFFPETRSKRSKQRKPSQTCRFLRPARTWQRSFTGQDGRELGRKFKAQCSVVTRYPLVESDILAGSTHSGRNRRRETAFSTMRLHAAKSEAFFRLFFLYSYASTCT